MSTPTHTAPKPEAQASLFILGRWRGVGKVYSVTERGVAKIHYCEEMEVRREGKAQAYWHHRQTWKTAPDAQDFASAEKIVPLHVESGVIKILPVQGTTLSVDATQAQEEQSAPAAPAVLPVEGIFIHPFSVSEVARGTVTSTSSSSSPSGLEDGQDGQEQGPRPYLRLEAREADGSFHRGPGAGGKATEVYIREYELLADGKLLYKCALKSNTMPEPWEHLECLLQRVDGEL
ncbi:unnamed protein product [Amoebophrya sp. A25]|nr:unnamed protein product [Amoebophrya sp. A25]|eukprot:GSA25T00010179001.1